MSANCDYRFLQARWSEEVVEITRASFATSAFVPHFHDGLAVGLVRSGTNVFRSSRKRIEVGKGSLCIVNAGEVHDGGLAGHPWSYDNMLVPWSLIVATASELGVAPELENHCVDEPECVEAACAFFSLAHDDHEYGEQLEEAGFRLLGVLLRRYSVTRRRPVKPEPLLATRGYELLRDRADGRVTLADLERSLGASRFQIIRAMQGHYGLTPHQLQLQLRVARARNLILTRMSIADAAFACGFADQAHLTREMKRRWGIAPGRMLRNAS